MKFDIHTAEVLKVSDHELSVLLAQVYVEGGYTEAGLAITLFESNAVRKRGLIIAARETEESVFAGMVIVVSADSTARRLALDNETEIHLLGVKLEYRKHGLGRLLVEAAIESAKQSGSDKMILWTQTGMSAAQKLYETSGFLRRKERDFNRNGRDFWVYEKELTTG